MDEEGEKRKKNIEWEKHEHKELVCEGWMPGMLYDLK